MSVAGIELLVAEVSMGRGEEGVCASDLEVRSLRVLPTTSGLE